MDFKIFQAGSAAKGVEWLVERYRLVTNIAGTILVAWLLAAAVSELLAMLIPSPPISRITPGTGPIPELGSELQPASSALDYAPICERNLFDSQKRTQCTEDIIATEETPLNLDAAPVKSDLKATLFGTMVSTIAEASFATVQAPSDKEPRTYRMGEKINNEGEIYEIQRNKVFFYRGGRREYLEIENIPAYQSKPSTATASKRPDYGIEDRGGKKVLPRKKVEELMANMTDLLQQARMVPDYQNGVVQGFKVFAIRPGSIFEQLGLKNGDTISQINGTKIDSLEKALPMLELLKTESNIGIDIMRGGSKQSISININ